MLKGLFGPGTLTGMLRGGLEETSATHKAIAQRVARTLQSSSVTEFSSDLAARSAAAQRTEEDLQRDMGALADTTLRYAADARLLHDAYAQFRTAMRDRG